MDAEELKRIIKEEVEKIKSAKKARLVPSPKSAEEEIIGEAVLRDEEVKEELYCTIEPAVSETVKENTSTEQIATDIAAVEEGSANNIEEIKEEKVEVDIEGIEMVDLVNVKSETVLHFIKCLFEKWHRETVPEDAIMKKIHREARSDLQPLLAQLKEQTLSLNVLVLIGEMIYAMQMRDYVKANDAYLRLAIGNAPWPIGVNSVIIHERTSQSRISSNQVAHVLNDEVGRKWIQMLKRLITYCQKIRPPNDRSKLVSFGNLLVCRCLELVLFKKLPVKVAFY